MILIIKSILDKDGVTALHWASGLGHLNTVELLLNLGAKVNPMDYVMSQFTPLDYALGGDHQDIIELLRANDGLTIDDIRWLSALKIQSRYRGYMIRKKFKPQKYIP